ncbi:uncharacterized protein MYCFIDRAFT_179270 [Pseudocercospora fijiensis CIRAD86]|uniref:DUF7730 domain-containing protein n=1 Tax=Pseudocercospora fijiensis (strain CIRAD86) TaxID=383855 RepID=M2YJ85_PSEFD|nr:uncharacterized protein MYCFIDRAFT_179270 [Pseudocercospora fijiensis CIRAD86]EME77780.1 hypothetical protein MYCFIDRAFT_179270 [Pseudocercospora fijiensis CIRAD86]
MLGRTVSVSHAIRRTRASLTNFIMTHEYTLSRQGSSEGHRTPITYSKEAPWLGRSQQHSPGARCELQNHKTVSAWRQRHVHGKTVCLEVVITELHVETMTMPQPSPTIANPISFLDLPPELRNEVYHLALIAERPLRVEERGRARPPSAYRNALTPALLQTCRTIWKDAAAIVYWNHAFVGYAHALGTFVRKLSSSWDWASRLRYLKVDRGMTKKDLVYLLASLRKATGLNYLGIFYQDVCPKYGPKEMAKKLGHLARAFRSAKERHPAVQDFVDIIEFYSEWIGSESSMDMTRPGRPRAIREYTLQFADISASVGSIRTRHGSGIISSAGGATTASSWSKTGLFAPSLGTSSTCLPTFANFAANYVIRHAKHLLSAHWAMQISWNIVFLRLSRSICVVLILHELNLWAKAACDSEVLTESCLIYKLRLRTTINRQELSSSMAFSTASHHNKNMSQQQEPPASFLALSAELRNQIYRLALCADTVSNPRFPARLHTNASQMPKEYLNMQPIPGPKKFTLYVEHPCRPERVPTNHQLSPNLIASCKQIQTESTSILYGENAFAMPVLTFLNFKDQILPFATHVRFLKLELDAQESSALSRSWGRGCGYISAAAYNLEEAFGAIVGFRELRSLEIEVMIKTSDGGGGIENIAGNIWGVVMFLMRGEGKVVSKVREVITLSFRLPSSVQMEEYEDMCEKAEGLLEGVYKALEDAVLGVEI